MSSISRHPAPPCGSREEGEPAAALMIARLTLRVSIQRGRHHQCVLKTITRTEVQAPRLFNVVALGVVEVGVQLQSVVHL